ncbi:MAG: serine hydroxymethyltransferase [Candidatus Paceibacterota bacterium]
MADTEINKIIKKEKARQKRVTNLIASENYVSNDVLKALGSELVNKYAEGYPNKRYYGGNDLIDEIELKAQERALKTFKLSDRNWSANVQPLSGTPANMAVYFALVPPGGKIMGMSLEQGGHLSHGFKVSATGVFWQQVPYGLDEKNERIDYEVVEELALKEKPNIIVAGFTAYPRKINWKRFREIADSCGAYLHVDMSHIAGLVAGGVHPSPFNYADTVMTTVHKTLRGPRAAIIWSRKDERNIADAVNKAIFPGLQGGPHMNQIAATAVALNEAGQSDFQSYAKQVVNNAKTLAQELKERGWRIISGGTDNHLLLVDTWMNGQGLSGKEASEKLEKKGIIVNKNTIPGETRSATDPSGIRLGTAAETTRGKKETDFVKIAGSIDKILRS